MNMAFAALETPHGIALLRDPLLNKGTAFTEQERGLSACVACCRRTSFRSSSRRSGC
jgi:hypothetical protein